MKKEREQDLLKTKLENIQITLREERKRQKINQVELCKKCNISQSYLSQIEQLKLVAPIHILHRIAIHLHLKVNLNIEKETLITKDNPQISQENTPNNNENII